MNGSNLREPGRVVGNRTIIRLGGDRQAAVSTFGGSLVLAGSSRPAVGFRSQAIVFRDSATGMLGRAVWTNENGDEAEQRGLEEKLRRPHKIHGRLCRRCARALSPKTPAATNSPGVSFWRVRTEPFRDNPLG